MRLVISVSALLAVVFSLNVSTRRTVKREIFIQQLASKIASGMERRAKRMVPDISSPANLSSPGSSAGHCSRHSVKINFNDIGWTHILAPRQVDFYYCQGDCRPLIVGPSAFTTS